MKTTLRVAAGLTLSTFLFSCAGGGLADSPERNTSSEVDSAYRNIEMQVIQQTNVYRAQKGLSALKVHSGLTKLARGHSAYMAKNSGNFNIHGQTITHYGFEGRADKAETFYKLNGAVENVGSTPNQTDPATQIMRSWINSPSHNNNLLGKTFTKIGVGVSKANGRYYFTMLEAYPSVSKPPPLVGPQYY